MKFFIYTIAIFFNTVQLFAQDTLITRNGETIGAKVIEVNQNEIKYKKSSNPDGPLYVIDKSDIVVIEYQNGSRDVFNTAANSSQDSNDSQKEPVYVNQRPSWNISIGALPYILGPWNWGWGWNNWCGRGWSGGLGWGRHHGGGGFAHHGHYGRRGGGHR